MLNLFATNLRANPSIELMVSDVLIFGAGSYARKLATAFRAEGITVHAILTSRPTTQARLDGIPCYGLDAVPKELRDIGPVACGVFNRADDYQELANILNNNHFDHILWPWDYYPKLHLQLGWCYWMDAEPRDLATWNTSDTFPVFTHLLGKLQQAFFPLNPSPALALN